MKLALALALACLLASPAAAVDLFEGNLGSDSHWLQVDGSSLGDRIYWYSTGALVYEVEFATDPGFADVVASFPAVTPNYVAPNLPPGSYYFRVRDLGEWSATGTLTVLADTEPPEAELLLPADGSTVRRGDPLVVEVEVSDDTVLRYARLTLDGVTVAIAGLSTDDDEGSPSYAKLLPSLGVPRVVVLEATVPKGRPDPLTVEVTVVDVVGNEVVVSATLTVAKGKP